MTSKSTFKKSGAKYPLLRKVEQNSNLIVAVAKWSKIAIPLAVGKWSKIATASAIATTASSVIALIIYIKNFQ